MERLLVGKQGNQSLGGRYEVISLLGEGGMAEVYAASDQLLGRHVALKVMRAALISDSKAVARFRREARAAASLCHPNIVSVHDVGMDGEVPFIVMELVRGETLSDLIRRAAPLPVERVAEVGEAVAQALAFAHDAGLVHRDVKPGNVMLTPSGQIKVLDFGIAQATSWTPLTDPPTVQGTAEYLSPEQAQGRTVDRRSDIYSLGLVLYELLTGRPPFVGETAGIVSQKRLHQEPTALRAIRTDVPPALEGIVAKCLARDPANRYQRASQVASDLRRFRAAPAEATVPIPPSRRTDELDAIVDEEWEPAGRMNSRFVSWGAVTAGLVAVILVVLTAVAAVTVPLFLRGRAQATARPQPLSPPAAVQARAGCDGFFKTRVTLTWQPSSSASADGYAIYRGESLDGPFRKIELLDGRATTTFVDAGLDTGTRYYYALRTTAGLRFSSYSALSETHTPSFCL